MANTTVINLPIQATPLANNDILVISRDGTNLNQTPLSSIKVFTDQLLFNTIAVAGQSNVIARNSTDTLTFVAGNNITITSNPTTDAITINASLSGSGSVTSVAVSASAGLFATGSPITSSGTIALSLANDTGAIEALTGTGLARRTGVDTWVLDAASYITGNQTVTLSGDVTGSGTTGITTSIANSAVTLGKMTNLPANTFIGNNTGISATPLALTTIQVTAALNPFTAVLKGLAPASGGGTTTFLRADGAWATPAGGGGGASATYSTDVTAGRAIVAGDLGNVLIHNSAANGTFTIPDDTTLALAGSSNNSFDIYQKGTGITTVVAGTNVTLNVWAGYPTSSQFVTQTIHRVGVNTWAIK